MEPLAHFNQWWTEAKQHPAISEPTAMTLATSTPDGHPSARIVLLKECSEQGFLFYTNHTSRKSNELKANPLAALCFFWMPMGRQVRVEGRVEAASDAEADAYFGSRPRERQLGAWASLQSQPMHTRDDLETRLVALEKEYDGRTIPRPPHWSGWRVVPQTIEFWTASEARLHVRDIYTRTDGVWVHSLLYP